MSSTTCITTSSSSSSGGINNSCQASPLPALPSIIRSDKETYLAQRLDLLSPLPQDLMKNNDDIISSTKSSSSSNGSNNTSSTKKKLPKSWISNFTSDPNRQCRLYMAPSTIPNSGLGMFAGVEITPNTLVDINPQLVLPISDIEEHIGSQAYDDSVLTNYPWLGQTQGVHLDAVSLNVLHPNLGMLANSHLGLANAVLGSPRRDRSRYSRIEERDVNPGTGAYTPLDGMSFHTSIETTISEGEEIFVDYGNSYFHYRESKWGILFPSSEDYKLADELLQEYVWDGNEETLEEAQAEWDDILMQLNHGAFNLERESELSEEEEKKSQQRIAYALPKLFKDTIHAAEVGTARYSVPDSSRSMDYLKENGICLDNLRKGKSNIPQAGYGAFATTNIKADSIVAPAPLLPIHRELLEMVFFDKNIDPREKIETTQLLHNYCFGHTNSSLLFFPYSSSVNYINHDNVNSNAYIRWSKSEMNQNDMMKKDIDDVYAGLVLEVIAKRDITFGEEVTIDYGTEWTMAWRHHVSEWKINHDKLRINPQSIIEKYTSLYEGMKTPFRTMDEREENPYPHCVRTACYSSRKNGIWMHTKFNVDSMRFCDIVERTYQDGVYWYTATESENENDEDEDDEQDDKADSGNKVLELIPHTAVFLVLDEYCSDQYVRGFRQEIGVPIDLYPDHWLDLKSEEVENDDDEYEEDEDTEEDIVVNYDADDDIDDDYYDDEAEGGEVAKVLCDTTAGKITMVLHRGWSPNGYDRAVELFERGWYDKTHFFRVVPGFLVQFGLSYTTDEDLQQFAQTAISDDSPIKSKAKFEEGTVSFAGSGPNSRTSHLFISDTSTNENFGTMDWETPVGYVFEGMDVVKRLNSSYGDMPPWGNGPEQHKISSLGRAYIEKEFPDLDEILRCIVERM